MIAKIALEIALHKEFDYLVPDQLLGIIQIGSRVRVPFGKSESYGIVTELLDIKPQYPLRPILRLASKPGLLTPPMIKLSRWIAEYYCCPLELVLKSVIPQVVRKEKETWKQQLVITLNPNPPDHSVLSQRQKEIFNIIKSQNQIPLATLLKNINTTVSTLRRLEEKGFIKISYGIIERDPYSDETIIPSNPLQLSPSQSQVLEKIIRAIDYTIKSKTESSAPGQVPKPFLLFGVTGSGKTEIYLQAIEHVLLNGKCAIVLVPEISLTPQTVERFKSRFSAGSVRTNVAVLHSHLSAGERHDEWHKIHDGRSKIIIGARSALFAPVQQLGLIIVDEEHELSYKQEEAPRYNARDVAVMRGYFENAVVVLGSATPSLESYYNAVNGKYTLLRLPERVDSKKLPTVKIIDMRHQVRKNQGPPVLSTKLIEEIKTRLENKEQIMLFLNRRGYATIMQCLKCGYVARCQNCSISLTYHRDVKQLRCHICGYETPAPSNCPQCNDPAIRFSGLGTQRIEEILKKLFPHAVIQRMDSDSFKKKEQYRKCLADFRKGKIDIMVGTQMIAKGLHFPNVTLVGIVNADLSLHIPDFRAGERTFQLLTQVAGRAGRGDIEGEVIVQTFTPHHPAIQFAKFHDYEGFFQHEIEFRNQLKYPPVSRLALLTLSSENNEKANFYSKAITKELETITSSIPDTSLTGPTEAPLAKAEGQYRYQILIRTSKMPILSKQLFKFSKDHKFPKDIKFVIDIDPICLM